MHRAGRDGDATPRSSASASRPALGVLKRLVKDRAERTYGFTLPGLSNFHHYQQDLPAVKGFPSKSSKSGKFARYFRPQPTSGAVPRDNHAVPATIIGWRM